MSRNLNYSLTLKELLLSPLLVTKETSEYGGYKFSNTILGIHLAYISCRGDFSKIKKIFKCFMKNLLNSSTGQDILIKKCINTTCSDKFNIDVNYQCSAAGSAGKSPCNPDKKTGDIFCEGTCPDTCRYCELSGKYWCGQPGYLPNAACPRIDQGGTHCTLCYNNATGPGGAWYCAPKGAKLPSGCEPN